MTDPMPDPGPDRPARTIAQLRAELEATAAPGPVPAPRAYGDPATSPLLVWIHGGGFLAGDLDMPESDAVGRGLAERGVAVLALDYRKAIHGVRFPAPVDDVAAGWREALTRHRRPFLGGASAGGALAAALARRLRGHGEPRGLVLAYPTLHADLPADTEVEARMAGVPEHRRFLPPLVRDMHVNFAGDAVDDPAATPGLDPGPGWPPLLVVSSDFDDLRASSTAFARAVAAAGGDVEHVVEPGTFHGHLNEPGHPGFARTLDRVAGWIRARADS